MCAASAATLIPCVPAISTLPTDSAASTKGASGWGCCCNDEQRIRSIAPGCDNDPVSCLGAGQRGTELLDGRDPLLRRWQHGRERRKANTDQHAHKRVQP